MNTFSLLLLAALPLGAFAQPDTLYVPENGVVTAYAVTYDPIQSSGQFKRLGHYTMDPSKLAVQLDYKQGRPTGVYRAYYPDGRPLIFAVYGPKGPHGDWSEYDELGRITVKGQYRDGLRDGVWAFRGDGIVGHYRKGLKHGKWKYYEQGHVIRVEKYRKDALLQGSHVRIGT
jgi:antitoxin component YwqK of YwqJK toxin-antitoxin module